MLDMEPAEIAVVLARASDLHSNLNDAILRTSAPDSDAADAFAHARTLAAIRDAFLSLQDHLDSLQALQKQQKAERDEVLAEIEESRKILIGRMKEYNGSEWEIIDEAHAFVGEPVQRKDELVLPPYQSPISDIASLGRDWQFGNIRRQNFARTSTSSLDEEQQEGDELTQETAPQQDGEEVARGSRKVSAGGGFANVLSGLGHGIRFTTKTVVMIGSVIAILTFSRLDLGLRDRFGQRVSKLRFLGKGTSDRSSSSTSDGPLVHDEFCPPGKVLLVQDGVQKCFVKERVEAPFKEVIKQPDASYGYG